MSEPMTALIARLLEAWNSHDIDRLGACYAEDCYGLDVAVARPQIGRAGVQAMFAAYYQAFPDLQITPDEVIVDGDRAALFWTARGTHQGTILNIPPSGRPIAARGVNRLIFQDGLVCETLTIWDVAGMLRGMGLLPDL